MNSDRMVEADKMAYMWSKYVNWKKGWCPNEPPTMEGFAQYLFFQHLRNFYDEFGH